MQYPVQIYWIFIVLLELKLQYSCIYCYVVCALRAKGQAFIGDFYWPKSGGRSWKAAGWH